MGIKNLNNVLKKYNLFKSISLKNQKEIILLIDFNCIIYKALYNTANEIEFQNKIKINLINIFKLFSFIELKKKELYFYIDKGEIKIKNILRQERQKIFNSEFEKYFFENRYQIINNLIINLQETFFNYKDNYITSKFIFTNEFETNTDAEFLIIYDCKNKFWKNNIFPIILSDDQDILFLLSQNQIQSTIIIYREFNKKYVSYELNANNITKTLSYLTLLFEGNDYINGVKFITSNILLIPEIESYINSIENYNINLNNVFKIIKNKKNKTLDQSNEKIIFNQKNIIEYLNLIESYKSINIDFYKNEFIKKYDINILELLFFLF